MLSLENIRFMNVLYKLNSKEISWEGIGRMTFLVAVWSYGHRRVAVYSVRHDTFREPQDGADSLHKICTNVYLHLNDSRCAKVV